MSDAEAPTSSVAGSDGFVFVTVGTDHHAFDRLMRWTDEWARTGGRRCVVQSGTSTPPDNAEWHDYLTHSELTRLVEEAVVVVCHGGPGTVMDCLQSGKKPIVVPRVLALDEHVDDHQVRFSRRIAEEGLVWIAEDEPRFRDLLTQATIDAASFATHAADRSVAPAVTAFAALVEPYLNTPRRGRRQRTRR